MCVGCERRRRQPRLQIPPERSRAGTILDVGVTVEKVQYLDLEKMAAAAFAVGSRNVREAGRPLTGRRYR